MTYALGRRVEADGHAGGAPHRPRRRRAELLKYRAFVQAIVQSPAFRMSADSARNDDRNGGARPE